MPAAPTASRLGDEIYARLYPGESGEAQDPIGWIEERLGERLWSKQREIAESVVEHRHTAVQSAHGTGKSFLASRLVAHWIATRPIGEAFAVTTAPSGPQVEAVIWRELGRAHAKGNLDGRLVGGAVPQWKIGPELVAYGRKPQDLVDPEQAAAAFQGIHARNLLVVLDEAAGVSPWLWDAVDSLATNVSARVLAIGNPTDPTSTFAKVCQPGSGWNVIKVSVFDTPAFTGERASRTLLEQLVSERWVEERGARWGVGSPLYRAKVLGEFPEEAEDTLISPAMIREAQERTIKPPPRPPTFSVDVARYGADETAVCINRHGRVRLVHRAHGEDTMQTAGRVARLLKATPGAAAVIDIVGVGSGLYDRLREQGLDVIPFQGSERAVQRQRFANRRAESYWQLREEFREGRIDIDPADEDLANQLQSIRWKLDSKSRTIIESKDEMKRRGLPSPDRADAVAMSMPHRAAVTATAFGDAEAHEEWMRGVWGDSHTPETYGGSITADLDDIDW